MDGRSLQDTDVTGAKAPTLRLLAGVETLHDTEGWALRQGTLVRHAKDAVQDAIVACIAKGGRSLAELEKAASACEGYGREDEASLALAGFILDFGEFLRG